MTMKRVSIGGALMATLLAGGLAIPIVAGPAVGHISDNGSYARMVGCENPFRFRHTKRKTHRKNPKGWKGSKAIPRGNDGGANLSGMRAGAQKRMRSCQ